MELYCEYIGKNSLLIIFTLTITVLLMLFWTDFLLCIFYVPSRVAN